MPRRESGGIQLCANMFNTCSTYIRLNLVIFRRGPQGAGCLFELLLINFTSPQGLTCMAQCLC